MFVCVSVAVREHICGTAGHTLSNASALDTLLHILNDIWSSGNFPPGWRTSTVIPVLKPGKEDTDPCSYHPIALTPYIWSESTRFFVCHLLCQVVLHFMKKPLVGIFWGLTTNSLVYSGYFFRRPDMSRKFCTASALLISG